MDIITTESSCHRCPVCDDLQRCADRQRAEATADDMQCDLSDHGCSSGDPPNELPPEGLGLAAAALLLFVVPVASGLIAAITMGQANTAETNTVQMNTVQMNAAQWLGGIAGFAVGMITAVWISSLVWNTDRFDFARNANRFD